MSLVAQPPPDHPDFVLPPLESFNISSVLNSSAPGNATCVTRTFVNCPKPPPPDCNGHGRLGGICFCICDPGYITEYKGGHPVRWCVPSNGRNGPGYRIEWINSTDPAEPGVPYDIGCGTSGFLRWLGTPMGAAITLTISFVVLLASACYCYLCYRRYKRAMAAKAGGGVGGGRGAHYNFYAGAPPTAAAEIRDSGLSLESSSTGGPGSARGSFFKTWWARKSASVKQQRPLQQQRSLRLGGGGSGGSIGGPGVGGAPAGGAVMSRRGTAATVLDAGMDASAAVAAQLLYLTQQQQQLMMQQRQEQQQQQDHPHLQQAQDRFWKKGHGARSTSMSGSVLSGSSRSYMNPLAFEPLGYNNMPDALLPLPAFHNRYNSRMGGSRTSSQRVIPLPSLGPYGGPSLHPLPTPEYDMYESGPDRAGAEQHGPRSNHTRNVAGYSMPAAGGSTGGGRDGGGGYGTDYRGGHVNSGGGGRAGSLAGGPRTGLPAWDPRTGLPPECRGMRFGSAPIAHTGTQQDGGGGRGGVTRGPGPRRKGASIAVGGYRGVGPGVSDVGGGRGGGGEWAQRETLDEPSPYDSRLAPPPRAVASPSLPGRRPAANAARGAAAGSAYDDGGELSDG